jgi:hypothetical protein
MGFFRNDNAMASVVGRPWGENAESKSSRSGRSEGEEIGEKREAIKA